MKLALGLLAMSAFALGVNAAKDLITTQRLLAHISKLSSDEFEGRAPSSKGEVLTVAYLTQQLKSFGLKPGNPNGAYEQDVPLFGMRSTPTTHLTSGTTDIPLTFRKDYVAWTVQPKPEIDIKDSGVVFVGYGVVAPEYGWDDYKGVDVKGKTIIMLVNDPAVPDPRDPSKLDDTMFKGKAMTYYGRWTYKYEIASKLGAAAAVIIHETGPAGYPFNVVVDSNSQENFDIQTPDRNASQVPVRAWMTFDKAKEIFAAAGQDLVALKKTATAKAFQPVTLDAHWSFHIKNQVREVRSKNVIGKVEGSDPKLKDEYVIFTSHWDHLGKNPDLKGDQIFNGAIDNASGCAGNLELARAFAKLNPAPKRSMLFLFVTAEEKGLLGSKYYASAPLYPLNKTLADINMDSMNMLGPTRDMLIIGLGNSTLDDDARRAADLQGGRGLKPDQEPEKGHFYRSDHFEFAKQGVPSLDVEPGVEYTGPQAAERLARAKAYSGSDYHAVTDEVKPDWDLSGQVLDLKLLFDIGLGVANGAKYPEWNAGNEFKAKRDSTMMGK